MQPGDDIPEVSALMVLGLRAESGNPLAIERFERRAISDAIGGKAQDVLTTLGILAVVTLALALLTTHPLARRIVFG